MRSFRRVVAAETARGKSGIAVNQPRKIIRIIVTAQSRYFGNRFFGLFEHGKRILDPQPDQIIHRWKPNRLHKTPRQAGPVQMQAVGQLFNAKLRLIPLAVDDPHGFARLVIFGPGPAA